MSSFENIWGILFSVLGFIFIILAWFLIKKIDTEFNVNLVLTMVALIARIANIIIFEDARDPLRIIISGICTGIVELSFQFIAI